MQQGFNYRILAGVFQANYVSLRWTHKFSLRFSEEVTPPALHSFKNGSLLRGYLPSALFGAQRLQVLSKVKVS
jgi:hypothetical protein